MPEDKIFRCQHCPFQKQVTSIVQYRQTFHNHVKKHHDGLGLPGAVRRPKVQKVTGGSKNCAWQCPKCKLGISHAVRQAISRHIFAKMRLDHRASHHPDISKEEWAKISHVKARPFVQQPIEVRRRFAEGCRRRRLLEGVLSEVKNPRFPGFQIFVWPVAKHLPGPKAAAKRRHSEQPIHRISLEHGWKCCRCGFATRTLSVVKQHAKSKCQLSKRDQHCREQRLAKFKVIQKWIASAKIHQKEAATLSAAVEAAIAAVSQVPSVGKHSSVF